jgi:hypothetical protein
MPSIEFVENYEDLSTDHGFQFRFHCDRCGNGFMSTFVTNKLGVAGGLLRAAGGLFGGVLGSAGGSAYEIQQAVGGPAHDNALREAVEEIKLLFHQCRRCGKWVCKPVCWNDEKGLCKECAPVLGEEIASAQAEAAKEQVIEKARNTDLIADVDIAAPAAAQCPKCGAATQGGKFCPDCGAPLAPKERHCTGCGSKIKEGSKFCPDCGAKV